MCTPSDKDCPYFAGEKMESSDISSDLDKKLDGLGEVDKFRNNFKINKGDTKIFLKNELPSQQNPMSVTTNTNLHVSVLFLKKGLLLKNFTKFDAKALKI